MSRYMFNLSRYWNRLAYKIVDLGLFMRWDYTGNSADIMDEYDCAREILTSVYKK